MDEVANQVLYMMKYACDVDKCMNKYGNHYKVCA